MKNNYPLLCLIIPLLLCANLNAQNFYKQSFGSGTSLPSGWSVAGDSWAVENASSSIPIPFSGNSNLVAMDCGGMGTLHSITLSGISTIGKLNIVLSYGIRRTLIFLPAITVEWSNNGSTWNTIPISSAGTFSGFIPTWHVVSSPVLPAGAEGQPNLRLRWSFQSTVLNSCVLGAFTNFRIDDVTLGQNSILPVTFSNIRAYKQGSGIKIDWSNLTESDIVNYGIERSSDGKTFTSLVQLQPAKTNGERSDYNFIDPSPNNGINFYRILSLETNGKKSYTAVMRVDMSNNNSGLFIYPNPVKDRQLSVQAGNVPKGEYNLMVYSTNGQQVCKQLVQVNGSNSNEIIQLPATLKSGLYNVQLNNGEIRLTKIFVIQ